VKVENAFGNQLIFAGREKMYKKRVCKTVCVQLCMQLLSFYYCISNVLGSSEKMLSFQIFTRHKQATTAQNPCATRKCSQICVNVPSTLNNRLVRISFFFLNPLMSNYLRGLQGDYFMNYNSYTIITSSVAFVYTMLRILLIWLRYFDNLR